MHLYTHPFHLSTKFKTVFEPKTSLNQNWKLTVEDESNI